MGKYLRTTPDTTNGNRSIPKSQSARCISPLTACGILDEDISLFFWFLVSASGRIVVVIKAPLMEKASLFYSLFTSVRVFTSIMHFSSSLITALFFLCSESSARADIRGRDLNSFVDTERAIALGVLNNIGPNGSQVPGTAAGLIIASPSKTDPDCEYLHY